ncbi:MAG: formylglycine-generating enzyme family protein [Dysgonamonadaceae bacterium]|jgi:formylglycine-generating enzyme required for sulfatase activity|nr:formylglycine-generating enzyme family protein [Dysgonamonadaceae bacterium]
MKTILLTITALFMMSANFAIAQVTIGSLDDPQEFSVLELVSTSGGLRLPQLDTDQRDALDFDGHADEARGLQIFNIDTKCIETWNGTEWIMQCDCGDHPCPPAPLSCGITASNSDKTFTAIADPAAVKYEFFDGTASQGVQTDNFITFATTRTPGNISVKYYYPLSFLMPAMVEVEGNDGSEWKYGNSNTPTTVTIPDLQWAKTEITQAQFEYVFPDRRGVNNSYDYYKRSDNYFTCLNNDTTAYAPSSSKPADMICWYDAIAYCNKLSAMEGKTPCYTVDGISNWLNFSYSSIPESSDDHTAWDAATCDFTADGYRLPTEWEWEYAARGGTANTSPVYSGSSYSDNSDNDAALGAVGWYWDNIDKTSGNADYGTHLVGGKDDNDLGLFDMSGNVWEWCWNKWDATYGSNIGTPFSTPTGTAEVSTGSSVTDVVRGGSWVNRASFCRVSLRNSYYPYLRDKDCGFRVVCK